MKIYSKFVSVQRYSEQIIAEKVRISPEFNDVLNVIFSDKFFFLNKLFIFKKAIVNGDSGDFILKKMLLLPMQRVTQYSLLIDKVCIVNV